MSIRRVLLSKEGILPEIDITKPLYSLDPDLDWTDEQFVLWHAIENIRRLLSDHPEMEEYFCKLILIMVGEINNSCRIQD